MANPIELAAEIAKIFDSKSASLKERESAIRIAHTMLYHPEYYSLVEDLEKPEKSSPECGKSHPSGRE